MKNDTIEVAANSPYLTHLWDEGYTPNNLVGAVLVTVEEDTRLEEVANNLSKIPGVQVNVISNLARQAKNNLLFMVKLLFRN